MFINPKHVTNRSRRNGRSDQSVSAEKTNPSRRRNKKRRSPKLMESQTKYPRR